MLDIEEILSSLAEQEEKSFKFRYEKTFMELQRMFAENVGYNRCLNDIQERYYQQLETEKKKNKSK